MGGALADGRRSGTGVRVKIDWMLVVLCSALLFIVLSFWKAHRTPGFNFNAFDLVMEGGKVDTEKTAFMIVLAMTTWLMIDIELKGKMTEGYLIIYGGLWVGPLVAKVIFKAKVPPTGTTVTSMTKTIESTEVTP
jgi:hypothetical protein